MRQRRQRLQVSTFPFLAVLLCAMGSLILLLLVIDRRAKIVARVKATRALEQAAQATAEDERAAAAHRAEWERRRRELHEQLVREDQELRSELQGIESQAAAATTKVEAGLAGNRQLQEQFQTERLRLAQLEDELSAHRVKAEKTARQADVSRADQSRLSAELERMERTLADLKALRQRQQQRYSLVPYRGKRGDNRRPLYIECTGDDLVFHPDHLAVHGWMLNPGGLRAEIQRRMAQQHPEIKAVNGKPEENAYLLMLIRPNGITTYYRTVAALKGLPIDFGYEFIDQDWILDFSENENAPKKQPWMATEKPLEKQPSGSFASSGPLSGPRTGRSPSLAGATGWWESSPQAKGLRGQPGVSAALAGASGWSGSSNDVPALVASRPGESGGLNAAPGEMGPISAPPTARDPNAALRAEAENGGGGNDAGVPYRQGAQPGVPSAGTALGRPMGIRATGSGGPDKSPLATTDGAGAAIANGSAAGMDSVSAARVSAESMNSPPASGSSRGGKLGTTRGSAYEQPDPPFAPGTMAKEGDKSYAAANRQPLNADQPSVSQAVQSKGPGEVRNEGTPGNSGNPAMDATPAPLPAFVSNRADRAGNPGNATPGTPAAPGAGSDSPTPGRPDAAGPLRGPPASPLEQLTAQSGQRNPNRNLPPRPGPLVGNRDWIILIECTAETVVLSSSGQRIAVTELFRGATGKNALLEIVQRMIARRQATVRPGEPPYRPMIRFRVRPDGLRSYYLAYPALESLQLPMTRENLDPEENKAARRQR
jgi:hypothetical protein